MNSRAPFLLDAARRQASVRLLSTTDLHVHLLSYDYYADRPAPHQGLVRTATLIRQMRAGGDTTLLFDNGDFLQGSPMSDWAAYANGPGEGRLHPMIRAMNTMGYDAATLGNHEFNYGLGFLQRALRQATFPVVSANVTTAKADDPSRDLLLIAPYVILDRRVRTSDGQDMPIRIGVIGFAPPTIEQTERLHLGPGIGARDIVDAARAHVPVLRAAGAEIVVALCHAGIGAEAHVPDMENAAVPLAAVEGIDVLMLGHTHMVFPGPETEASAVIDPVHGTIHGKPAVMAGFHGSHLGVVDLAIEHDGTRWRPVGHHVRTLPIARIDPVRKVQEPVIAPDAQLSSTLQESHLRLLGVIRRPIGATEVPLTSYFSMIRHDHALQVVADAQRSHARTVLAGSAAGILPLLSSVAPFKTGGRGGPTHYLDVPPGPLSLRHASDLYVYPNRLCILELSTDDVVDWLERSAAAFAQITPGETKQPLLNPAAPGYNFDTLEGLTYTIDPSRPPRYGADGTLIDPERSRILNVCWQGKPVQSGMRFVVVTNSYRASGGGGFEVATRGRLLHTSEFSNHDVVLHHLRGAGTLRPQLRPLWRFARLPGTEAWFETGPGASNWFGAGLEGTSLAGAHAVRAEGLTETGFLRCILRLG